MNEFDPLFMPWIYLLVSVTSMLVTRVFQWCSRRFTRKQVVAGTFFWAVACKLFFLQALPLGGQRITALFYLWASVYFLLLVPTLWGCLNERFRPDQCQRCFPFIALGSTIGGIAGSSVAQSMSRWGTGTLLWSIGSLLLSLSLLWPELSYPVQMSERKVEQPSATGLGWLGDRYLKAIAVMVLTLAIYSTATDFITQRRLDAILGQEAYQKEVSAIWPTGYAQINDLRKLGSGQRPAALRQLALDHKVEPEQLQAAYDRFRETREKRSREVFANIFYYQGIAGILFLGVFCRPFLRYFGLRAALVVLPTFALCVLPMLLFPLDLLAIQLILIFSGSLNYSFNNATKEILYSATDRVSLLQAKPVIEGPLMRLGDVIFSTESIVVGGAVAYFAWPLPWIERLMVAPCFLAVAAWWILVRRAGQAYQSRDLLPHEIPADEGAEESLGS
ncbi:hypothetical protein ABS71_13560 [bacterium SCN 62-11]|nr:hypothetical protein [Candidatus Eremiobacteraeota bacterium]ODT64097.1 MAG: hypothetical protein ABS71_13560 [bacterium SCN 62-11]